MATMPVAEEKWKRELMHERQKVTSRWFIYAILVIIFFVITVRGTIPLLAGSFIPLTVLGAVVNGGLHFFLRRATRVPGWMKYATVTFDMAVAAVVVLVTGGPYSVFYSLFFIILISNSFRYGMGMSLLVALLENLFYPIVLYLWGRLPQESRIFSFNDFPLHYSLFLEGCKILIFWGVALYSGYLASRLKRQSNELLSLYERIHNLEEQKSGKGERGEVKGESGDRG